MGRESTLKSSPSKSRLQEIQNEMMQQYGFKRSEIRRFERKVRKNPNKFRAMSQDKIVSYIKRGRVFSRMKKILLALLVIIIVVFSQAPKKINDSFGTQKAISVNGVMTRADSATKEPALTKPVENQGNITAENVVTGENPLIIPNPPAYAAESESESKYSLKTDEILNDNFTVSEETAETFDAETVFSDVATETPNETNEVLEEITVTPETEKVDYSEYSFNDISELKGRGFADVAGVEPDYVNSNGYVAVYKGSGLDDSLNCLDTPWQVPVYQKSLNGWQECGLINHKTWIGILDQDLTRKNGKEYQGYLKFVDFSTDTIGYINVVNFVTSPYWEYEYLDDSVEKGYGIAVYKQLSDYRPVYRDGNKATISEKEKVLLLEKGSFYVSASDKLNHSILGVLFVENNGVLEKKYIFFNRKDLTLVY